MIKLFLWTIFEVTSSSDLQGIKFRGTLRKFAISKELNLLAENADDNKKVVRFAILDKDAGPLTVEVLEDFIKSICTDAQISLLNSGIQNPVLSKIKVNDTSRYQI